MPLSLSGDPRENLVHVQISTISNNTKDVDRISEQVHAAMRKLRATFKALNMNMPPETSLGQSPMQVDPLDPRAHFVAETFQFIYHAL